MSFSGTLTIIDSQSLILFQDFQDKYKPLMGVGHDSYGNSSRKYGIVQENRMIRPIICPNKIWVEMARKKYELSPHMVHVK